MKQTFSMKSKCLALAMGLAIFSVGLSNNAWADGVWMPGAWGMGDDWNPDSNDFSDAGGGLYENAMTGLTAGEQYTFKIIEDANGDSIGNWDDDTVVPSGSDIAVYADGSGAIDVDFDSNTGRYLVSSFQTVNDWFAVGTFQDESGAAADWDNMAAETRMSAIGGGIYEFVSPIIAAGTYEWKATTNGWDFQVGDEGVNVNGTTQEFTVDGTQSVRMTMNSNTQSISIQVQAVPEPGTFGLLAVAGIIGLIRRRR